MSDGIDITRVTSFDGRPVVYRPNEDIEVFGTFVPLTATERVDFENLSNALKADDQVAALSSLGEVYAEHAEEIVADADNIESLTDRALREGGWVVIDEEKTDPMIVFTGLMLGQIENTEDGVLRTAVFASEVERVKE